MSASPGMAVVLSRLRPQESESSLLGGDPAVCAEVLGVSGVAVTVRAGATPNELVWATPGASTALEDAQFTLGQGPGPDVSRTHSAVLVPDVSELAQDRWPMLRPTLETYGIRALFCLPLTLGGACLGTLTLQRATAGDLAVPAMNDLLLLSRALTAVIASPPPGQLAAFAEARAPSDLYWGAVHQATGMISVQAGVSLADALLLLRAHAFQQGRSTVQVADDVVARRLRFSHEGPTPGQSGESRG
ncbi:GAF domain-containing protein [Streptomyces sp. NPDC054842]